MVIAKIKVTGTSAVRIWSQKIPAGLVGGKVQIEYADPIWDGLDKTVVFCGYVVKDVINAGTEVTIPAEVVAKSGFSVSVGVYGTATDGSLAIPTVWADIGIVQKATDPSWDTSTNPHLPIWAEMAARRPDWQAPEGSPTHIRNRTHWMESGPVDNTFDGNMNGREVIQLDAEAYLVKISDTVLTRQELIGSTITAYFEGEVVSAEITEDFLYDLNEEGIPAITVSELVFCIQSNVTMDGISAEKGTYFLCVTEDGAPTVYTISLSALPDIGPVYHKLDNRYLNAEWMACLEPGVEVLLEESVQYFGSGTPKNSRLTYDFEIGEGKQYSVSWNGTTYSCIAGVMDVGDFAVPYVGNLAIADSDMYNSGEPFLVISLVIQGINLGTVIMTREEAAEHTVKIMQTGMVKQRIPFDFAPRIYTIPTDFVLGSVIKDEIQSAYLHWLKGGTVYAYYNRKRYKILGMDVDLLDGYTYSFSMAAGTTLMFYHNYYGWTKYTHSGFTICTTDYFQPDGNGKKFRVTVDADGNLKTTEISADATV